MPFQIISDIYTFFLLVVVDISQPLFNLHQRFLNRELFVISDFVIRNMKTILRNWSFHLPQPILLTFFSTGWAKIKGLSQIGKSKR